MHISLVAQSLLYPLTTLQFLRYLYLGIGIVLICLCKDAVAY